MATTPRIAVQRLNPRHRDDIVRHLLRLPADDRRLRFGRSISDAAVGDYVGGIDFERDRVFGIQAPDLSRWPPSAQRRSRASPSARSPPT